MSRYLLSRLLLIFLFAKCIFCASSPFPTENEKAEIDRCIAVWIEANSMITSRFSRENMTTICQRHQHWVQMAQKGIDINKLLTPNQLAYWRRFKDCRGNDCLKILPITTPAMPVTNTTTTTTARPNFTPTTTTSATTARRILAKRAYYDRKPGHDYMRHQTTRRRYADSGYSMPQSTPRQHADAGYSMPQTTPGYSGPLYTNAVNIPQAMALRKEYRLLTDQERARYHAAINKLKLMMVDGVSRYDIFKRIHTSAKSPGAHFGHSFLPWHREFLKQYELALREIDPSVALPYWDSSLDQPLPNPADSIMWTKDFFGTADGKVVTGPFSDWAVLVDEPDMLPWLERHITAGEAMNLFYKDSDVQFVLDRTKFDQFSWCVDPTFEGAHGGVHVAVGGQMGGLPSSPSDPLFYMHHCFVDYMWEQFRQSRQSPAQREQEYPNESCDQNDVYLADAPMQPFDGQKNKDGLSNRYTQEIYSYQQRPVCTSCRSACTPSSPYLFCDNRSNKCMAKVRPGGNCNGFEDQDVCYNSKCINGRCVGKE